MKNNKLMNLNELELLRRKEINFLKKFYCYSKSYNIISSRNYCSYKFQLNIPNIYLRKNLRNRLKFLGYEYLGLQVTGSIKVSKAEFLKDLKEKGSSNTYLEKPIYSHVFEKTYFIN